MPQENIDTDQIIPARFLKNTKREGFGDNLFRDWRFDENGEKISSFVLNESKQGAKILVAGSNFGCGSSREHAAWALYDYGIRVVVSPYFADIFKENALNNGLLPVEVSETFYTSLIEEITIDNETQLQVNLDKQEIQLTVSGEKERFNIQPYKKNNLKEGIGDLDYLVSIRNEISDFEKKQK